MWDLVDVGLFLSWKILADIGILTCPLSFMAGSLPLFYPRQSLKSALHTDAYIVD